MIKLSTRFTLGCCARPLDLDYYIWTTAGTRAGMLMVNQRRLSL